jgi:hypothetical protein
MPLNNNTSGFATLAVVSVTDSKIAADLECKNL